MARATKKKLRDSKARPALQAPENGGHKRRAYGAGYRCTSWTKSNHSHTYELLSRKSNYFHTYAKTREFCRRADILDCRTAKTESRNQPEGWPLHGRAGGAPSPVEITGGESFERECLYVGAEAPTP